MYRLEYWIGSSVIESIMFPNRALAVWKKNQLFNQDTHRVGTFKINRV